MELDTRIPALCARAQGDPHKPFPTFALALALFDEPAWDALSPQRPLRFYRLIDLHQNGVLPLTASPLRADERIVHYVKGLNHLDERLTTLCSLMEPGRSVFRSDLLTGHEPGMGSAGVSPAVFGVPAENAGLGTDLDQPTGTSAGSDRDGRGPLARLFMASPSFHLAVSQAEVVEALLDQLGQVPPAAPLPVVQLAGADAEAKQLVAGEAAARLGCALYRVAVEALPPAPADLEALARLWLRESRLLPLALYLDAQELDAAALDKLEPLKRFLNRTDGYAFLAVREPLPALGQRPVTVFDLTKPTPAEQQGCWAQVLGEIAADAPAALAAQFNLNLPGIRRLASSLVPPRGTGRGEGSSEACSGPDSTASLLDHLWTACCLSQRPRLDTLAQRLEPKVSWDDLVLPETEMGLLRQIAAQVAQRRKVYGDWGFDRKMSRGLGISALFAGASGTGKTMAAEVLARELRLNLYRIDLSAVVSKYIGETEKNLRRLFDAAEEGGAVLFFDEADALFGKRSEVKESHDRYANIEINYLLQRIEAYRGLAILATNMKSALDAAFLRRLRFIVNFPFPDLADRRQVWEKVFPKPEPARGLDGVPTESLDFDRLARFNLVGGHIHNVALNAAFLAAQAGTAVTMSLILESIRTEMQKLDRPVNDADFQWVRRNGGDRPVAIIPVDRL